MMPVDSPLLDPCNVGPVGAFARQGTAGEPQGDLFQAWAAAQAKVAGSNSLMPAVMVGPHRPHLMHSQWVEV
jgi:hypothetical protein